MAFVVLVDLLPFDGSLTLRAAQLRRYRLNQIGTQ